MEHELARFPPVLQLVGLGLLGAYVLLSIVGRLSDRFEWMWDDPDDVHGTMHVLEYTVVPALVLFTAAVAVYLNWDRQAPLDGGWTLRQLTLGPIAAAAGVLLVALAATVQRRGGFAASAQGQARAWLPFVAMLLGIALMSVGIFSLGKTVKRMERRPPATAAPGS